MALSPFVADISGTTHITYSERSSDFSYICVTSFQFTSYCQCPTQISLHSILRPSPDTMEACSAHLASTVQMSGGFTSIWGNSQLIRCGVVDKCSSLFKVDYKKTQ